MAWSLFVLWLDFAYLDLAYVPTVERVRNGETYEQCKVQEAVYRKHNRVVSAWCEPRK